MIPLSDVGGSSANVLVSCVPAATSCSSRCHSADRAIAFSSGMPSSRASSKEAPKAVKARSVFVTATLDRQSARHGSRFASRQVFDDTVVGLDNGVGDRGFPFDGADGDDRPSPIRTDVAQAIREVTLALPTQTRDAVWRYTYEDLRIDLQTAQELQPIKQAVR